MSIVTIDGIPVFRATISDEDTGMFRISLVDAPAVESNFVAFDKNRKTQMYAVADEEKRLVLGVVMRSDFPIFRRDESLGEYYVIYTADTIRQMAEKYLSEGRQNEVNLMHRPGSEVDGLEMVQYFIKDSAKGIAPEGFDVADGSLFAEFHVLNDEVWAAIKEGTYKGFSLEGVFDLEPERSKDRVQEIVDALEGMFSKIYKPKNTEEMTKIKGILARLAKALVEMGNITTDKGVLSWDGDEDLKAGDAVFVEDSEGKRVPAEDGEYITADNKTIVVVDGKVSEIKDPEAEVAPAQEEAAEEPAAEKTAAVKAIETDKGKLMWDNEDEDLKEGDAVFVIDEEGNRVPAPDGDYTTEDGKVITVVEGKVASIVDPKAEVDEEESKEYAELKALREENEALRSQLEEQKAVNEAMHAELKSLKDKPAAKAAHIEATEAARIEKTGNKGLDNLSRILSAGRK